MENLVGRRVKCIQEHESIPMTKGQSYVIIEDDGNLIRFKINSRERIFGICTHKDLAEKEFFELLPNEPKFKQGDKVLVSYNEIDWHETEFVCYYKDYYYTINGRAKNIKPYKEEIKVGDWVKYDNQVFKVDGKELSSFLLECTKITNPQLIELLNNEL